MIVDNEAGEAMTQPGPAAVLVTDVYFAVPGTGGYGPRFPSWPEAASHARSTIERAEYPGQLVNPGLPEYHPRRHFQEGVALVCYSRAFVELRVTEPVQDRPGCGPYGSDSAVARWEVFRDGTAEETIPYVMRGPQLPEDAEYPQPGSEIPRVHGYVVGECTHQVSRVRWLAGFRSCADCQPEPAAAR